MVLGRVVKGMIPERISYLHPHFCPILCLNLRKKGMENPRKSHLLYKPGSKGTIRKIYNKNVPSTYLYTNYVIQIRKILYV